MTALLAGFASFVYVALKAFQQLNVVHDRRRWVMPVSLAMAACEAVVIVENARAGLDAALIGSIGVGGGLGCLLSMGIHRRLRER